jgi:predicted RNase H-like nuclease (RuvC/YqgF family)
MKTKPSIFRRLRPKFREHRAKLKQATYTIRLLNRDLSDQRSKTEELEQRLKRYAAADTLTNPLNRTIELCIHLDAKAARKYPELIEEAFRQLAHKTRSALARL